MIYRNKAKKNILVICPGFASDCVETLRRNKYSRKRKLFENMEEKILILIPCLNENSDHIHLFETLVKRYLVI